jgi:hypothetical protein
MLILFVVSCLLPDGLLLHSIPVRGSASDGGLHQNQPIQLTLRQLYNISKPKSSRGFVAVQKIKINHTKNREI